MPYIWRVSRVKKSIKNRISISAGLCFIVSIVLLISVNAFYFNNIKTLVLERTQSESRTQAKKQLASIAQAQAGVINKLLTESAGIVNGMVTTMLSMVEDPAIEPSRAHTNEYVKNVLKRSPNIVGAYISWLPNAVDARDAEFKLQGKHTHSNGQFAPYWTRNASGDLGLRPLDLTVIDNERTAGKVFGAGWWYLCPEKTQKTCVLEPYSWKIQNKLMLGTSITMPLITNGQIVGISGIDITINFLQKLADDVQQSIYEGEGNVLIISNKGLIAGDSAQPNRVGKAINAQERELYLNKISAGRAYTNSDMNNTWALAPVSITGQTDKWAIVVQLPNTVVMASAISTEKLFNDNFSDTMTSLILVSIVVITLGIFVVNLIAQSIASPIKKTAKLVDELASNDGDLTLRVNIKRQDEIGQLADGVNLFVTKTHDIVKDINGQLTSVATSANNSSEISTKTNQGVLKQLAEIDQVATAITEMTAVASDVAQNARFTAESASSAKESVIKGAENVDGSVEAISILANEMAQASHVMDQLAGDSKNISSIVEVIRGISEQTNLLALNAAIEAARAGEQGRGFAVVADEVRSLASKTQKSTGEIQALIDSLQLRSKQAVDVMANGNQYTNNCIERAKAAADQLSTVVEAIASIDDMSAQIATAVAEQQTVTEDVTRNINNINLVAQEVGAGATQTNEESKQLLVLVSGLEQQINRFKY
jgi:methyl-accepting chemotaxis protein